MSGNGNMKKVDEDSSLHLVGSVVEKGFSVESFVRAPSVPRPTVLPFPVARHRSDGPHRVPVGSVMNVDDMDVEDDKDETDFNSIALFADPIQGKQKKKLDFSGWRELVRQDCPTGTKEIKTGNIGESKSIKGKREREELCNVKKRNMLELGSDNVDGCSLTEMETEVSIKSGISTTNAADSLTSDLGSSHLEPAARVGGDNLYSDPAPRVGGTKDLVTDQSGMSLEGQIDAENRARLQQMSSDEIAELQAEMAGKMKPGLIEMLKKRGQNKFRKQNVLTSDLDCGSQSGSLYSADPSNEGPKSENLCEQAKSSNESAKMPSENIHGASDNCGATKLRTLQSNLWNSWSERVEAARTLRFSIEGDVLGRDSAQAHNTGNSPHDKGHIANSITERDFLRTEGDPGAAGYTIKEAITLNRSMIPGQRALALQLLAAVLDKALYNMQQTEVGNDVRNACKTGKCVDWQAIWAFALGPEPNLALSLRMALDDSHASVVLAGVKVINCILSGDMNERYFDISEKLPAYQKGLCTAPVFRSRPEINVGFLHGGFWKYNAKSSSILPVYDETVDDASEEKRTIQDDIVMAGQDFAAGLVRMGVLPRICYLLETDPSATMEEYLISILIGLGRHSPTCANAIINCPRLIQTLVDKFAEKDTLGINPSKIKSLILIKVLAQSDIKNCINFIEKGIFGKMTWYFYSYPSTLDDWINLGGAYSRLMSALMVEQLRLWRVCINYGYCISSFTDFFPTLCLWLTRPTFDKLIEKNILGDFVSITREAYLVLEALARKLPNLHSGKQLILQPLESMDAETWSWSHVSPMVELGLKWISLNNDCTKGASNSSVQDGSNSHLLWVVASVIHMLASILKKVVPEAADSLNASGQIPWLPEFVPKIGLEILRNGYLNISGAHDMALSEGGSFVKDLRQLRLTSDYELSLASVCCLHGIVQLIVSIDNCVQRAKIRNYKSSQGYDFSNEGKILEDGIIICSHDELRNILTTSMKLVASGWQNVQSIEIFGRGGPAPGVGQGWGASGGGFWSKIVLLEQTEAQLLMDLLEIFQIVWSGNVSTVEDLTFTAQRIDSSLGACLTVGPRDTVIMDKALEFLLQAPVLKYLNIFISRLFDVHRNIKPFGSKYDDDDYFCFGKVLNTHFRNRWLSVKGKSKTATCSTDLSHKTFKKGGNPLGTIYEDLEKSDMSSCDSHSALVIEWAHQKMPLPLHWFLSPIATVGDSIAAADLPNASNVNNQMSPADEALQVAKSGLFLLLGLEAVSSFLCADIKLSPIRYVPLVWKLHSLSVVLLHGMSVLEGQSRDMYATLQDLYGQLIDESLCDRGIRLSSEMLLLENRNKSGKEFLKFQSDIHESYSTFLETLVEQFGAVSYGDVIYGRQIAMYLHSFVEVPVRISAWSALSNARILDLLPPLENCYAATEGYLNFEDNEGILEGYMKSWMSGGLDKAAARGSMTFTLALHHLSSFIFHNSADDKLLLRYKLAKSLLRDYSHKQHHEAMMLGFVQYTWSAASQESEGKDNSVQTSEMERRFELLMEACEGNSSLLTQVEKLKSSYAKRC